MSRVQLALRVADLEASIDFYTPSADGKSVAVSLSEGGSEEGTLHVFDVATGKKRPDTPWNPLFPQQPPPPDRATLNTVARAADLAEGIDA